MLGTKDLLPADTLFFSKMHNVDTSSTIFQLHAKAVRLYSYMFHKKMYSYMQISWLPNWVSRLFDISWTSSQRQSFTNLAEFVEVQICNFVRFPPYSPTLRLNSGVNADLTRCKFGTSAKFNTGQRNTVSDSWCCY
jgi:hypothetical protein